LDSLEKLRSPDPEPPPVDAILADALRGAELLREVPREQLMARFMALGEEIRQEAIAKATAVDGDYTGDWPATGLSGGAKRCPL